MSEELWGGAGRSGPAAPQQLHRALRVADGLVLLPASQPVHSSFTTHGQLQAVLTRPPTAGCATPLELDMNCCILLGRERGSAGWRLRALVGLHLIHTPSSHHGHKGAAAGDSQTQGHSAAHCLGERDWRRRRSQSLGARAVLPSLQLAACRAAEKQAAARQPGAGSDGRGSAAGHRHSSACDAAQGARIREREPITVHAAKQHVA